MRVARPGQDGAPAPGLNDLYFATAENGRFGSVSQAEELSEEETRRKLSRGFVAVMLLQCYSRGHVAITSSDPRSLPTVRHKRLSMRSG